MAAPPAAEGPDRLRRYAAGTLFLTPALVLLVVWILYPTVYTIGRSFFSPSGSQFVWFDNYKTVFTTSSLLTAIKNNAIWVLVVPAFVTAIGLVFAVLTEQVSWSVAFKTAIFLPMAISAFATGITWRIMYIQDPNLGAVNALGRVVVDAVTNARRLAVRIAVDAGPHGHAVLGARTEDAAPPWWRRAARADGHRARGGTGRREAGRPARAEAGRDRRRRLA